MYNARHIAVISLVFAFCLFQACTASKKNVHGKVQDVANWVNTLHDSLHIKTYKNGMRTDKPNLVVVLHGDAPFNNPGYQYILASLIARQNTNTIAVAILRPGYTDSEGVRSPGIRGLTTGDNYTPQVVDGIAAAINNLKELYHPGKTIIAGHSGGSAITADIIGRHPGVADAAVLVSCPCNVPEWRAHMKMLQHNAPIWDKPVKSLSPNTLVDSIDMRTKIVVVTGENDDVAPTALSVNYYKQLKQRGLDAQLVTVNGAGHEIFLTASVRNAVSTLLNSK
ncbi:MAG TPA: alpha/beta fold hydrolase [Chitinophagaceae bacterium]|nr:alpha/beta fold hydrolase [Chitinophagaceae bacterium]